MSFNWKQPLRSFVQQVAQKVEQMEPQPEYIDAAVREYLTEEGAQVGYSVIDGNLSVNLTGVNTPSADVASIGGNPIVPDSVAAGSVTDAMLAQTGGVLSKVGDVTQEVMSSNLWQPTETGYYYTKGGTKTSSDGFAYQVIEGLTAGDVINAYYWYNDTSGYTVQPMMRFVTAYVSDVANSSLGAENASTYTVPENVTKVIVSVSVSQYTHDICVMKNNAAAPTMTKIPYFEPYTIIETDSTLTDPELPANAKAVGDALVPYRDLLMNKFVHVSIDDFTEWAALIANAETYTSIYDNAKFAYLKELHDTYGAVFTLNCFIESGDYDISDVPSTFAAEFEAAKDWLKFSFHGTNVDELFNTDMPDTIAGYYDTFVAAIYQMTGTYECIDRVARLSSYTGTLQNVVALRDRVAGIKGLLAGETENTAGYYLDSTQKSYISKHDKLYDPSTFLTFIRSFTRIPTADDPTVLDDSTCANYTPMVELFWHDTDAWTSNYWKTTFIVPWMEYLAAASNGYKFDYSERVWRL